MREGQSCISDACHAHIRDVLLVKLIENAHQCKESCDYKIANDENDYFVSAIESAIFHGIRRRCVDVPGIKEFTGLLNRFSNLDIGVTSCHDEFWSAIKSVLSDHDVQHLQSLTCINTDLGRIRSWLRFALNECSVVPFLTALLDDDTLLRKSHEEWAFLRDKNKLTSLTTIMKELYGVHFSMVVDSSNWNRPFSTEFDDLSSLSFHGAKNAPCPVMVINGNDDEVRCVRKPQVSVISFNKDTNDNDVSASTDDCMASCSSTTSVQASESTVYKDAHETTDAYDETVLFQSDNASTETLNRLLDQFAILRLEFDELRGTFANYKLSSSLELERLFAISRSVGSQETYCSASDSTATSSNLETPHEELASSEIDDAKFHQLTTMYSEVIEMNNMLLSQIVRQNSAIRCLQSELQKFRFGSGHQKSSSNVPEEIFPYGHASFILVWIPTAFMTGKGIDVHHVYQTYIKTSTDEFTVYRRYNEFCSLRKAMAERDDKVYRIPFPRKRKFFFKNEKFVELRRHQLETFLRELMNYMVLCFPELSSTNPSRKTLASLSTFFK